YSMELYPDLLFVRFLKRGEVAATCTYREAWERASQWAALLIERGMRCGERVVLALPNSDDFVYAYFGTLLAGGIPAPSAPIRRLSSNNHYLVNVTQRLHSIDAKVLIVPETQAYLAGVAPLSSIKGLSVLTRRDVQSTSQHFTPKGSEYDLGLLQFTSG